MAEFCGKIVIFAQKNDKISIVKGHEIEVTHVERPACDDWFVEAIWHNLVLMSCEGKKAPFFCIFDLLTLKVTSQSSENLPMLHFPYISESGFFVNDEKVNDMENLLKTLFNYDYAENMKLISE